LDMTCYAFIVRHLLIERISSENPLNGRLSNAN
jgi:hypothetical protein